MRQGHAQASASVPGRVFRPGPPAGPRLLAVGTDDWRRLVEGQQGVVSRRQVLPYMSSRVLERRVLSGRWQVAHRGVYVTHNGPLSREQQLWVASLAVGNGHRALLGGLSALEILGLRRFDSDLIHVVLPARRQDANPPAGVLVHRTSTIIAADISTVGRPPCTAAARSMVDAARWARSDREARTIIAMCLQQRLVSIADADTVVRRLHRIPRHALIRATLSDVDGGSVTITELDLVRLCRAYGLPEPSRQVLRHDADGRNRYLDASFDEWRVIVEVDGAHHMQVEQWWQDMRRHNALSVHGEILLRFPAFVVREEPAEVAAIIRDALRQSGWPG